MRQDPVEVDMKRSVSRRAIERPHKVSHLATQGGELVPEAVDEAFATLGAAERVRIDGATACDLQGETPEATTRSLVAGIVSQLAALDRQREQLSRLLDAAEPAES